jgi:predicted GNAT family acetyltransferase
MSEHEPTPDEHVPTTTHAAWGAGHPRLLVVRDDERQVHEITTDVTRIGSSPDAELNLPATQPMHAMVTHDPTDEYVLQMFGAGETSLHDWRTIGTGSHDVEVLRTGAHFSTGPWRLVFARDEFADHGRPYGGRQGGEGAHQRRQPPRPDYAQMLAEAVITHASMDADAENAADFRLVDDTAAGIYLAVVGDREVAGVTYNLIGDHRIVLLAVSVFPEFRGRGIAMELIRQVLDEVRAQGRTVTNYCPVVLTFLERHPSYAELIDSEHPGVVSHETKGGPTA